MTGGDDEEEEEEEGEISMEENEGNMKSDRERAREKKK